MTWDDVIGAELDAGDPTAAPTYTGEEIPETIDVFASADIDDDWDEPEVWTPEVGFTDATGALRVWIDHAGRLTDMKLTRYWRDRSAHTTLTEMFTDVLTWTRAYCPATPEPVTVTAPTTPKPELTRAWLSQISDHMADLNAQLEALDPTEAESSWEGSEATGDAEEGRVKVTLDIHGRSAGVTVDPNWAATASVTAIARAVMIAERAAEARHVPPTYIPGARADILARFRGAHDDIIRAMRGGLPGYPPPPEHGQSEE